MMGFHEILTAVYQIQGAADPAHPPETLAERMAEIYAQCCAIMRKTGFDPD